jgi:5-methyltetrahydrofolate--homocysteine methyltransferase
VTFDELAAAYLEQVRGLIDGGVDACSSKHLRHAQRQSGAVRRAEVLRRRRPRSAAHDFGHHYRRLGPHALGPTVEAFWNSIRHLPLLSVGLNCALGASQLKQYVEELSRISDVHISAYPNAGLPNAFGGYDESAQDSRARGRLPQGRHRDRGGWLLWHHAAAIAELSRLAEQYKPRALPGKELKIENEELKTGTVAPQSVQDFNSSFLIFNSTGTRLAGLEPFNITPSSLFVNVGERCNVTGSRAFARLIAPAPTKKPWPWPACKSRKAPRCSTSTWTKACSTRSRP